MTLAEQLEELRNNILRDRSDLIGDPDDNLWSDETLLRYIGDAERRFARRTLMLRDNTTTAVTQITLVSGSTTYLTHPSVIGVLSARYDTQQYDLRRSGHAIVVDSTPPEFLTFDPTAPYTLPPGNPIAYYTDETLVYNQQGGVALSVYPAPGADQDGKKLYMRVIRLPLGTYTETDLTLNSDIPQDYQLDVLEWAAYRAQRSFDGDAGAPTTADAHKVAFEEAIKRAQQETKRKLFANTGFRYGGNGFSWQR